MAEKPIEEPEQGRVFYELLENRRSYGQVMQMLIVELFKHFIVLTNKTGIVTAAPVDEPKPVLKYSCNLTIENYTGTGLPATIIITPPFVMMVSFYCLNILFIHVIGGKEIITKFSYFDNQRSLAALIAEHVYRAKHIAKMKVCLAELIAELIAKHVYRAKHIAKMKVCLAEHVYRAKHIAKMKVCLAELIA